MSTHATATMMAVSPETKPFHQSKTFWFNLLGGAMEIAQVLAGANILPAGAVTLGLAVGNIFLRWLTKQPMEFVMDPKNATPPTMMQMPDPKHGGHK